MSIYDSSTVQDEILEWYRKQPNDINIFSSKIVDLNVIFQKINEIKSLGKGHDELNASI